MDSENGQVSPRGRKTDEHATTRPTLCVVCVVCGGVARAAESVIVMVGIAKEEPEEETIHYVISKRNIVNKATM